MVAWNRAAMTVLDFGSRCTHSTGKRGSKGRITEGWMCGRAGELAPRIARAEMACADTAGRVSPSQGVAARRYRKCRRRVLTLPGGQLLSESCERTGANVDVCRW
jgi:hypothetical protein